MPACDVLLYLIILIAHVRPETPQVLGARTHGDQTWRMRVPYGAGHIASPLVGITKMGDTWDL